RSDAGGVRPSLARGGCGAGRRACAALAHVLPVTHRSSMRAALITCGILALAAALLALPAAAQSTEAEARALFEAGVALYDRGELDGAGGRFRRSLPLRPAASVRYNLAAVLADTGRLAGARELYLVVAGDVRAPAEVRRTSRDNARELHER